MAFINSLKTVLLIVLILGAGLLALYLMQGKFDSNAAEGEVKKKVKKKKSSSEDGEVDNDDDTDEESEGSEEDENTSDSEEKASNEDEDDDDSGLGEVVVDSVFDLFGLCAKLSANIIKTICIIIGVLLFVLLTWQLIKTLGAAMSTQQTGISLFG